MKIGYARVSTKEQSLDLQIDALKKEGCQKIYAEKVSGVKSDRIKLDKLMQNVKAGDIVIVYKLDRIGRSLLHLIKTFNFLMEKGVQVKSLGEPIDTTSSHGKFMFTIFGALAEFEKDLIKERTLAGLKYAKKQGRLGGRPKGLSKKAQDTALLAKILYQQNTLTSREIIEKLSISRTTLYRYLKIQNIPTFSSQKPYKY